jgi:LacI family transcriptional regulator
MYHSSPLAAEQLGYQPNALARGLLAGRTFTVGLITTDSFGRFSIPVMQGAEDALGPGRIAVLLCDSRDDQIREQHYLRTLLERRVDGIIVTGRRQDPREPIGSDIPVPVVYAMTSSTNPGTSPSSPTTPKAARSRSATCSAPGGPGSAT